MAAMENYKVPAHVKIYHAGGGLRVLRSMPEGASKVLPDGCVNRNLTFHDLLGVVGGLIGVDLLTHQDQAEGLVPPEWQVSEFISGKVLWRLKDLHEKLQLYSSSALEGGVSGLEASIWELRLHLMTCENYLRSLSQTYHQQLTDLAARKNWGPGTWVTSVHTYQLLASTYAFLQEAAVLRDVVARMVARHRPEVVGGEACDSMAQLLRLSKKGPKDEDRIAAITALIEGANDEWMRELGQFRDCHVHAIPLSWKFSSTECREEGDIRFINHYLPDSPSQWRQEFAWELVNELPRDTQRAVEIRDRMRRHFAMKRDALKYSHFILLNFCALIENLMPLISPVAPSKELPEIKPIPGTAKWIPDLPFKQGSARNRPEMPTENDDSKQKEGVTGFGIPEEWEDFVERHRLFFDRFPNLRSSMHAAFIRTVTISRPVDRLVFYFGRLCVEDFFEILLLCGNGYGIGGMKILRGMYERTVTAWYLHLHPDEADDFLDYHFVARRKQIRAIKETFGADVLPPEKVAELEDQYQRVKEKFMITDCETCGTKKLNHTWTKLDFVSMARKAGSIGKLIVPAYYQPIEHTHPTAGGMLARLGWDGEKVTFHEGAQREEADSTLITAHNLILSMLDLQREHFGLTDLEDQLQRCFQDFQEIWA